MTGKLWKEASDGYTGNRIIKGFFKKSIELRLEILLQSLLHYCNSEFYFLHSFLIFYFFKRKIKASIKGKKGGF